MVEVRIATRLALIGFTIATSQGALAAQGDQHCFKLYAQTGAIPGDVSCPPEASSFQAGIGDGYCGDPARVARYCEGRLPPPCPNGGNPIAIATGEKFLVEVDMRGDYGLDVSRTYSSLPNSSRYSAFGQSWRASFDAAIEYPDDWPLGTEPTVSVIRPDGHIIFFKKVGTNWQTMSDVTERLVELKDGSGNRTGWVYSPNEGGIETFNARGLRTSKKSAEGRTVQFFYSTASTPTSVAPRPDLLIEIRNDMGRTLKLYYTSGERVQRIVDETGNEVYYEYEYIIDGERLVQVYYPGSPSGSVFGSTRRQYHYNEQANTSNTTFEIGLTGFSDEQPDFSFRRVATYQYDADHRAISTTRAGGADAFTVTYPSALTRVGTDALGSPRTYTFTSIQFVPMLTSQSQPAGAGCAATSKSLTYDANRNVTSSLDFNQRRSCFAYDSRNLETVRLEGLPDTTACPATLSAYSISAGASQRKVTSQWHPNWRFRTRQAAPKLITTWVYNGQPDPTAGGATATCAPAGTTVDGKPQAVLCKRVEQPTSDESGTSGFSATSQGTARTWAWTYNSRGQVLTEDGPRTDVTDTTTYAYRTADDPATPKKYRNGDLWTVTDSKGFITEVQERDPVGRPTKIVEPTGLSTTVNYHPRGWVLDVTQTNASATQSLVSLYEYDAVGMVKKATRPDGTYVEYTYDDASRLVSARDSSGNSVSYTLDGAGNATAEEYRDLANVIKRSIARSIDALNRVQAITGAQQ